MVHAAVMAGAVGAAALFGSLLYLRSRAHDSVNGSLNVIRRRPGIRALMNSRDTRFDRLHIIVPSTVRPGEPVQATVQAWDRYERLTRCSRHFTVSTTDPDAIASATVTFDTEDEGVVRTEVTLKSPGIHYVILEADGERYVSNPIKVATDGEHVYWGDIHLHSQYSDGVGSVAQGFRFGRDVMDLDVVAYTDHDTMGFFIPPRLQALRMQHRFIPKTKQVVNEFYEPGSFVTLMAYEWTKQPFQGGHINLYFDTVDDAPFLHSKHPDTDTVEGLWDALRDWKTGTGNDVVTIPHHTADSMYPFNFSEMDYDDELAPLVEVYSRWGSSEHPEEDGNNIPIRMQNGEISDPGHYVQDAHALGHRVGMVGGADFHGPRPGHSNIHTPPQLPRLLDVRRDGLGWGHIWRMWDEHGYPGGLTAFYAPDLTRDAIFTSLKNRAVYATNQPHRILVDFSVNGTRLADATEQVTVASETAAREITFEVAGTAPIDRVELVKNNTVWKQIQGEEQRSGLDGYVVRDTVTDTAPVTGLWFDEEHGSESDAYYLRVIQVDGGRAWAGPIWVGVAD